MTIPRRQLVAALLFGIAITAVLGIAAIFGGDDETLGQTVATTATLTGAGVLALAYVDALERHLVPIVALLGLVTSVVGFGMIVIGIWADPGSGFWQVAGSLVWIGAWAAVVCVHARARLAPRFRWTFWVSSGLGALVTLMGLAAIWDESDESTGFWQFFGVLAILYAAFALAVPILHRASRGEVAQEEAAPEPDTLRFCPSCGRRLGETSGDAATCPACGSGFTVQFRGSSATL
jgi:peptidoglycan/LPS O-acetylase OafA/YrhL